MIIDDNLFQVLNNISIDKNHTLVLPVPKIFLQTNNSFPEEEAALLQVWKIKLNSLKN